MFDVKFTSCVVGITNLVANFSGQDLQTQAVGVVVPWTYDFQSGDTFLDFDAIPATALGEFDSQDMEALPTGPITGLPGGPASSVVSTFLLAGVIAQVLNIGYDDLESYAIGAITNLNNSVSGGGDITMLVGLVRPNP